MSRYKINNKTFIIAAMVILLCLVSITGATLALFTSTTEDGKIGINATSGNLKVDIVDASENPSSLVGDVLDEGGFAESIGEDYDVVVANIVADVIIALAPAAFRHARPGAVFITSGIIEEREEPVMQAILDAGFELVEPVRQGGWSCMVFRKPE